MPTTSPCTLGCCSIFSIPLEFSRESPEPLVVLGFFILSQDVWCNLHIAMYGLNSQVLRMSAHVYLATPVRSLI